MNLTADEKTKLLPLLDRLNAAIEDFVVGGVTVASESTRQTLGVVFQEASRMKLLRLGSTLRMANDELSRYTKNEPDFSPKRLAFFINRSWLLGKAIKKAIEEGNDQELGQLIWVPAGVPVSKLEVATIGVVKKATASICAFDFYLRTISDSEYGPAGKGLIWSCIFPVTAGSEVPPEGYLHLPQPQKFNPSLLLEKKSIQIDKANVSTTKLGISRASLTPDSTVSSGDKFEEWERFMEWSPKPVLEKINNHKTGPLDLEVELQDEVVLKDWQLGETPDWETDENVFYSLKTGILTFNLSLSKKDKDESNNILETLKKAKPESHKIFGLLHFENCKMIFQPVTVFDGKGPRYLQISDKKIDRAALLRTLKF